MENFDIEVPNVRLFDLTFGYTSADEIKALSVKELSNPQTFDSLLHPTIGGLYDPALGPSDRDDLCFTCGMNNFHCPGHFGHITLPLPVFNPVFFKTFYQILKGSCFSCHRLHARSLPAALLLHQLKLLRHGLLHQVWELQEHVYQLQEQAGSTAGSIDTIHEEIHAYTEKCLADGPPSCNDVKNVAEIRRLLVKEFLANYFTGSAKCPHCHMPMQVLRQENNSKLCLYHTKDKRQILKALEAREKMKLQRRQQALKVEDVEEVLLEEDAQNATNIEKTASSGQTYLTPLEARSHLRQVWEKDGGILRALFGAMSAGHGATECSTDIFFLDVVPVPPTRFRPISMMNGRKYENPQTANLARVLADCAIIKHILGAIDRENKATDPVPPCDQIEKMSLDTTPGKTLTEKLQNAWVRLQMHTNCVVDSDLDKISTDKHPGIKQLLEKKDGLFRKHMMGKRVNFAARSVISPDPCIEMCEIGLPLVFATKLTYPQPVTPWNVHELRQAVINGPEVHPGATFVMNEDGSKVVLSAGNKSQREAIAKQLLTPSSYNKSQLGVKKVFRHIKNGDMMLLNRQPTLHRPSIQAHKVHVLPGEKTLRLHYANCKAYNADFDGDEMNAHFPQSELGKAEAVNIASTDHNYLVPKDGTPLAGLLQDHMIAGVWLTIRGRFFHRDDYHQLVYTGMTDVSGPVKLLPPAIRRPAVLWSGKQVLSTLLLNIIPEGKAPLNLIGKSKIPEKSWKNAISRRLPLSYSEEEMGESYVVIRGGELLCGVLDKGHYGPTPYGLVHSCYELYGGGIAGKLLTCLAKLFTSFLQMCRGFTLGVEDILCVPRAEKRRHLVMTEAEDLGRIASAKAVNLDENASVEMIAAKLQAAQHDKNSTGLQDWDLCMKSVTDDIQNRIAKICLPLGLEKVFPENNLQLMVQSGAKGSTVNTMQISCLLGQIELEGRRPPLMLSGKFLPSFRPYDTAPRAGGFIDGRFLTGIRPQEYFHHCMAGREGLVDTAVKTSRSGYLQRCLIKHLEGIMVNYDMTVRDSDGSIIQFQYGEDGMDVCKTAFLNTKQFPFLIDNVEVEANNLDLNRSLSKRVRKHHSKLLHSSMSEVHDNNQISEDFFRQLISSKYMKALAEPGDAVGLLMAQSIGEPSTQMTLNTFHFAGRGEMNVTLGIPRLREILMVASANIKTPAMDIPIFDNDHAVARVKKLQKNLAKVTLAQVLHEVKVVESLSVLNKQDRSRIFRVSYSFLPEACYQEDIIVTPISILQYIEKTYLKHLVVIINKKVQELMNSSIVSSGSVRQMNAGADINESADTSRPPEPDDENNVTDDEANDGDSTAVKHVSRQQDVHDYEGEEEEVQDLVREGVEDVGDVQDVEIVIEDVEEEEENEDDEIDDPANTEKKQSRVNSVLGLSPNIVAYKYDTRRHLWMEVTMKFGVANSKMDLISIIEEDARRVIIHQIPGVSKAFISEEKGVCGEKEKHLKTEGINMEEIYKHQDIVDIRRLYSNDIHAMAKRYGIEAAARIIVKEVSNVFAAYGIGVDYRHLSLLSDYMTFEGSYKPFNRLAMESNPSPLQQMSFETTMHFLVDSSIQGRKDPLKSPSARIVTGRVVSSGTGCFDLRQPLF